ncbi:MAG: carbohydrate kinase [Rhodobacteraceae bacterium]|nr:carbohydrate kinase [Paracoccaceae bacterium]MCW9043024.1 carbohydrate kinase [Pseudopelagicola sp.]
MILCCGEAVIDMLPTTDPDGQAAFRPVTGGAAVNMAIALARLGQSVGYFGGLSTDHFGTTLCDTMQAEGVNLALAPRFDAPTTLAFIHPGEGTQSFSFYDTQSAAHHLGPLNLPPLDGVTTLAFGGISLIHRPAAGAFEALMQMAGPDRLILFDPNIRPDLIGDVNADYRKRLARMMPMADIVKVSDEDLEWLGPLSPHDLLSGRAALILHTHGAKGITLHSRHGSARIAAPDCDVIDTVGAGDTLNAALLAALGDTTPLTPRVLGLADADTLYNAAAFATRAATFSTTRPGANPPTHKDLI